MRLNKIYSKTYIGEHFSHTFPIQNGLKQGDALPPLLLNFASEYRMGHINFWSMLMMLVY
jgi:hypothetical protein